MLQVTWPVLDPAMRDNEAMADAAMEWPSFAEGYQVTVLENPRIRVELLDEAGRRKHKADRVVICEAPVFKRERTTPHERKAA